MSRFLPIPDIISARIPERDLSRSPPPSNLRYSFTCISWWSVLFTPFFCSSNTWTFTDRIREGFFDESVSKLLLNTITEYQQKKYTLTYYNDSCCAQLNWYLPTYNFSKNATKQHGKWSGWFIAEKTSWYCYLTSLIKTAVFEIHIFFVCHCVL